MAALIALASALAAALIAATSAARRERAMRLAHREEAALQALADAAFARRDAFLVLATTIDPAAELLDAFARADAAFSLRREAVRALRVRDLCREWQAATASATEDPVDAQAADAAWQALVVALGRAIRETA